jgi:hypothetical protein
VDELLWLHAGNMAVSVSKRSRHIAPRILRFRLEPPPNPAPMIANPPNGNHIATGKPKCPIDAVVVVRAVVSMVRVTDEGL